MRLSWLTFLLNVFVFGDFNVHHEDWLTYFGGSNIPGELCYNFPISDNRTQMINFLTWISDCDSHSPSLLDLFISSDSSICSTISFPPLWNSNHLVAVSIDFLSNSQQNAPFHHIAYDYTHADCVNFVSRFRLELMCIWTQSEMLYRMLTFEKTKILFFKKSLMKSSGKISREH